MRVLPRLPTSHLRHKFSSTRNGELKKWVALWGNGEFGRLGLSAPHSRLQPTICRNLDQHQPCSIACGGAHTLILTEEGRVFATGLNDYGQLGLPLESGYTLEPIEVKGLPDKCVYIAAGYHHSAVICGESLYVWGRNDHGQLGVGKGHSIVCKPQKVDALVGVQLKMVSLGAQHSLALTEDGQVLSWGAGKNGRLGHARLSGMFSMFYNMSEYYPRLIRSLDGFRIQKISTGLLHSACVDDHGTIFTFGEGRCSQLGHENRKEIFEPASIDAIPPMKEIACGGYHSGAITRNGDLYMWGSNEHGCIGSGLHGHSVLPTRIEGDLVTYAVEMVSCGWKHTAAIAGGQIFSWGWGGSQGTFSDEGLSSGGQLGLGNEFDFLEPSLVSVEHNMVALHISCGFNHTGAIIEDNDDV